MSRSGGVPEQPIHPSRHVIEDVKRVLTDKSKTAEEIQADVRIYRGRWYKISHIIAALEGMYFAGQAAKQWPSGEVGKGEIRWHR